MATLFGRCMLDIATVVLLQVGLDVVNFGYSPLSAAVPSDGFQTGFLFLSSTFKNNQAFVACRRFSNTHLTAIPKPLTATFGRTITKLMETKNIYKSQGWKNILQIIIPYFFIVGISQLIGFYFAGLDIGNYKNIHETSKQMFIITFFSLVGTFAVVWLFRKYLDRKTFPSLGFMKSFLVKDTIVGLAFGFIIIFLGFTCLFLTKQIYFLGIQFQPIEFFLSIGVFIFVAISEELILRGYILNNLMVSFNKYVALIISSIIFSLLHAANPNYNLLSFIGLCTAGLFFGLAYIYTKSLWFPIALHFSWNFFQGTIFGFSVSGRDTYSLIVIKDNALNNWNGGNFGFEGSILSIILQLFAIAFVIIIFKNRLTTDKLLDPVDKAAANISIANSGA